MNIPFFSFLMISSYVCHYEGEEVAAFGKRLGERLADGAWAWRSPCPPGPASPTAGRAVSWAPSTPSGFVRYVPGERWEARRADGKAVERPFLGAALAFARRVAVPLGLPGAWRRMVVEQHGGRRVIRFRRPKGPGFGIDAGFYLSVLSTRRSPMPPDPAVGEPQGRDTEPSSASGCRC